MFCFMYKWEYLISGYFRLRNSVQCVILTGFRTFVRSFKDYPIKYKDYLMCAFMEDLSGDFSELEQSELLLL